MATFVKQIVLTIFKTIFKKEQSKIRATEALIHLSGPHAITINNVLTQKSLLVYLGMYTIKLLLAENLVHMGNP